MSTDLPLLRDGHLLVDGLPYPIVGAEVHNSSSGSAAAIEHRSAPLQNWV